MIVVVTGGAGFIGSHLVDALLADSQVTRVRVVDDLSTGHERHLRLPRRKLEFVRGSVNDPAVLKEALTGAELVFHQAAIPSVPRSVESPSEAFTSGIAATFAVLEQARVSGARRVVLASSSAVYGDSKVSPKVESLPSCPLSPYAANKHALEDFASAYARCYALDTVALRYFNVFGPRQDPTSPYSGVIARFTDALRDGQELTVYGDGEQTRDFVYVADVVRANLFAGFAPGRLKGQAINIGSGRKTSINQLLAELAKLTNKTPKVKFEPVRTGDILHSVADIELAEKLLGFEPGTDLAEGLRRTLLPS